MVNPSTLVDGRFYVWAPTPKSAESQVKTYLRSHGQKNVMLVARWTGTTRPGSYDYTGSYQENNIKEVIGVSQRRFRVDVEG
jgi:hypothetical protein